MVPEGKAILTVGFVPKLVPVMVTVYELPAYQVLGETPVTFGDGSTTVKVSGLLVPKLFDMVRDRGPVEALVDIE